MSDWSDYFEHFPEKNPATWVDGKFEPKLAIKLLDDKRHDDVNTEKSNAELIEIIEKVKQETKLHLLLADEDSPTDKIRKYFTYVNNKISEFMGQRHFS